VFLNLFANGFYAVTRRGRAGDAEFVPTLKITTRDAGRFERRHFYRTFRLFDRSLSFDVVLENTCALRH
jgi:hypothetical protein